jgi:hypothetical protein
MDLEAVARRLELEQLYTDCAHCLDADEFERRPDFFTEDCFYRIISVENYDAGLQLGLIYATSRNTARKERSTLETLDELMAFLTEATSDGVSGRLQARGARHHGRPVTRRRPADRHFTPIHR